MPQAASCPQGGSGLPALVSARAGELFAENKYNCAASVLISLNEAFAGGLSREQCLALTAGMISGLNSGCVCGALNGAVCALGLILGSEKPARRASRRMHDAFRDEFGATCCRLLRQNDARQPRERRRRACLERTMKSAELACLLLREAGAQEEPNLPASGRTKVSFFRRLVLSGAKAKY